ncbi:hypothetical protein [Sporomusa malonica]|uniref:Uncharacterized protein n=1 Tax=Sporomusa malonica TaxID=112901 RepID=A0A1W1ZR73_9FIRM|nr:hypothetical protein [Sporomusa malonica]SMC50722.1 hypothetical protein SAMN04488500_104123 [Sporomusa malonica]
MKILSDILKQAAASEKQSNGKLRVVDTVASFWQNVYKNNMKAKIFDASALLESFSKASPPMNSFARDVEFGNLSPLAQSIWVEVADSKLPAHLGVALSYTEKTAQSAEQAKQYGINSPFTWVCQARSFIKRRYQQTLPLKWEWVEYIDDKGRTVSSLLQPAVIPQYMDKALAVELKSVEFIHHHLCAFIANLGFYAIDQINGGRVSVSSHAGTQYSYHVLETKTNVLHSGFNWTKYVD